MLPDPDHSQVALIGVADYDGLPVLPAVRQNIADLKDSLADPALWGVPEKNLHQVINPASRSQLAEPIIRAARSAEDTLVVYYAGHGLLDGRDMTFYLAPTAARDGDLVGLEGLEYDWVRHRIDDSRAKRKVIILDCCYSGSATLGPQSTQIQLTLGQLDVAGTLLLTSAPANSVAAAPLGARHTAFTGALLTAVAAGLPGGGEFYPFQDLVPAIRAALYAGGFPSPQEMGTNTVGRLALVRNALWSQAEPVSEPVRMTPRPPDAAVAAGVRAAADAAARTLGLAEAGDVLAALDELEVGSDAEREGVARTRELAGNMRAQFGDGAATAVVMAGTLVERAAVAVVEGEASEPWRSGLAAYLPIVRDRLLGHARTPVTPELMRTVLAGALGDDAVISAVGDAAATVGGRGVAVWPADGPGNRIEETSRWRLPTVVLAPTATALLPTLRNALVVVAPDGWVELRALPLKRRQPLLVITPRMDPYVARSILRPFAETVVVRPADRTTDLGLVRRELRSLLGPAGVAKRVFIDRTETAIVAVRPAGSEHSDRATVWVGRTPQESDAEARARTMTATRAAAIARAAEDGGLVAGAGITLYRVGRELPSTSAGGVRAAVAEALAAPLDRLARNAGVDPRAVRDRVDDGTGAWWDERDPVPLEPVATLLAAFAGAVSIVLRWLAPPH